MTKSELKTGMIVTMADGRKCMVLRDVETSLKQVHDALVDVNNRNHWFDLANYLEDMTNRFSSEFNIVEISQLKHPCDIIKNQTAYTDTKLFWTRPKKKKQYTYAQLREILGEEFEVVG